MLDAPLPSPFVGELEPGVEPVCGCMLRLELDERPASSLAVAFGSMDLRAEREDERPGELPTFRAELDKLTAIRAIEDELDTSRIRPVAECIMPLGLAARSGMMADASAVRSIEA